MGRDVVSAKLDVIFKKIFTENQDLLHEFIADILEIPSKSITKIQITNPEIPPETVNGKFSRLDLNMKVDNQLVNVEIQVKNYNDYKERALFYWAKLFTSELKSGENYRELKKTITINIINFNMFDNNNYHTEVVSVIKDTNEIFSDKFNIHFFELKKVNKKVNPNNRREMWLQFIKADKEEDFEMIKETNVPVMEKAVRVIYDYSEDTRIREMARMREKALHDEASALATSRAEGKAEGRAEGIAEMVEMMRNSNISEEQIQAMLEKMGESK